MCLDCEFFTGLTEAEIKQIFTFVQGMGRESQVDESMPCYEKLSTDQVDKIEELVFFNDPLTLTIADVAFALVNV